MFMTSIVIARPRFYSIILKMGLQMPLGRYQSWPTHIAGQYGSLSALVIGIAK